MSQHPAGVQAKGRSCRSCRSKLLDTCWRQDHIFTPPQKVYNKRLSIKTPWPLVSQIGAFPKSLSISCWILLVYGSQSSTEMALSWTVWASSLCPMLPWIISVPAGIGDPAGIFQMLQGPPKDTVNNQRGSWPLLPQFPNLLGECALNELSGDTHIKPEAEPEPWI